MRRRFGWILAVGLILGLSAPAKAQVAVSFGGGPYGGFGLTVGQPYYGGFYPGYGYGSAFYGSPFAYGAGFAPYRSSYFRSYSYGYGYPRAFSYGSAYFAPGYGYRSFGYGPYYGGRRYIGGPGWGGYRRW
jgi:hypothetical protein